MIKHDKMNCKLQGRSLGNPCDISTGNLGDIDFVQVKAQPSCWGNRILDHIHKDQGSDDQKMLCIPWTIESVSVQSMVTGYFDRDRAVSGPTSRDFSCHD